MTDLLTRPTEAAPPTGEAAETWALVERAQAGDQAAHADLYRIYRPQVYWIVWLRLGRRPWMRPVAEDITQDVFVRALKRIGSFTWQGRDIGAWLGTIARNLVTDYFKRGATQREMSSDIVGDVLSGLVEDPSAEGGPEHTVVEHLMAARTRAALTAAIAELTPGQRECIELRFVRGLSVAETAQAMGRQLPAIKTLQHRAVAALGQRLRDSLPAELQPRGGAR
jgi:RNA polymerase sigma-70 factor (ECF subfamily)